MDKKGFRNFQLLCLAFISLFIGPQVIFVTTLIYRLPFPQSISETATIANQSSMILPFCLGALALFALTYSIRYAYDYKWDRVFTVGMFCGFTTVAFQPCISEYLIQDRVGILGLNHFWSNIFHYQGAFVGFASFLLWILICFKRSDVPKRFQTQEKLQRNNIYTILGGLMICSLILLPLNLQGLFGDNFAITMWIEIGMLTFGGFACMIKSGLMLKDK